MAIGAAAYKSNNPISLDDIANLFEVDSQQDWKPENGFGVEEFLAVLHPKIPGKKRQGQVAFMRRVPSEVAGEKDEWPTSYCRTDDAGGFAKRYLTTGGGRDLYVSMATFNRKRAVSEVCAVESTFCDLDYHNTSLLGRDPVAVAKNIIRDLTDAGKPLPSFIMSSGRGLLCVWLHEMLSARVLPKWRAIQKEQAAFLKSYGADTNAADPARVFRIVGSINSKADAIRNRVQIVWGDHKNLVRHTFEDLGKGWLPKSKEDFIASFAEERAKRVAKGKLKVKSPRPNGEAKASGLWQTRLNDIEKLIRYRYGSKPVSVGMQDKFLFLIAVALSQTTHPETILPIMRKKASELSGGTWTEGSTDSSMGTAYRRAVDALNGATIEFDGEQVDPRYRFRSSTIIDWLDISEEEMRDADLRDLASDDIKAANKAEGSRERSRAFRIRVKGQKTSREEQRQDRLVIGRKAIALRDQGKTVADICTELSCSRAFFFKVIKEAGEGNVPQSSNDIGMYDSSVTLKGAAHYTRVRIVDSHSGDLATTADVIDFPGDDLMDFPGDIPMTGLTSFASITDTLDLIPETSSKPREWPSSMRIGTSTGSSRRTA